MKILCLNPPFKGEFGRFSRTSRSPAITKSGTLYYPFWLAYAAGVLEDDGFHVELIDAPASELSIKEVLRQVEDSSPEMVVVETSTPSIRSDLDIGCAIKRLLENVFVVMVGTHPSALPTETLEMAPEIDAVCLGEYDYTVRDLARCIKDKKHQKDVAGLVFRKNGKMIRTGFRKKIENLDSLPFVSRVYRAHLDYRNYFFAAGTYPMMMIITGRGCPFRCFFCVYPQTFHGSHYRLRTAGNVIDEFEYILNNFPEVKSIGIEDDTFSAKPLRVVEICKGLIERGINRRISWWANTRVNLGFDVMKIMKKAGCRLVIPGFESGCQEILNGLNKGISVEQSFCFMRDAKKAGLLVHGCFMVGNPGESKETMEKTLEFAKKLNPDTAQFFPLIPYPGTRAYEWAKSNRLLVEEDFARWVTEEGLHKCVIRTNDLIPEGILAFCDKARREFYLRPAYLTRKLLQSISSFQEARRNFMSFKILAKHLLH